MKRIFLLVAALLLVAGPASSGSLTLLGVGGPSGGSGGTVLFDAVSSGFNNGNGSSLTFSWTHTPVGTPTAVAVACMNYDGGTTIVGITYGITSMAKAISQSFGAGNIFSAQIWGLPNPPSGVQTITVTTAGVNPYTQCGAITVTGSSLTTAFDASNGAASTSGTASVAVSSLTGEFVVDVVGNGSTDSSLTPGGSQTLRWGPQAAGGDVAAGSSLPAGASSTTMSWTLGASEAWGIAAASFHK